VVALTGASAHTITNVPAGGARTAIFAGGHPHGYTDCARAPLKLDVASR